MSNKANIIYWNQEYRNDFIRLNREWIERYFRLAASIHLYHKLGFKAVEMTHPAYDRCDLCMEITLNGR